MRKSDACSECKTVSSREFLTKRQIILFFTLFLVTIRYQTKTATFPPGFMLLTCVTVCVKSNTCIAFSENICK